MVSVLCFKTQTDLAELYLGCEFIDNFCPETCIAGCFQRHVEYSLQS